MRKRHENRLSIFCRPCPLPTILLEGLKRAPLQGKQQAVRLRASLFYDRHFSLLVPDHFHPADPCPMSTAASLAFKFKTHNSMKYFFHYCTYLFHAESLLLSSRFRRQPHRRMLAKEPALRVCLPPSSMNHPFNETALTAAATRARGMEHLVSRWSMHPACINRARARSPVRTPP